MYLGSEIKRDGRKKRIHLAAKNKAFRDLFCVALDMRKKVLRYRREEKN